MRSIRIGLITLSVAMAIKSNLATCSVRKTCHGMISSRSMFILQLRFFVALLVLSFILHGSITVGLQPNQQESQLPRHHFPTPLRPVLNHKRLVESIDSGRVYQQEDFLSESEVLQLLDEIEDLESNRKFRTKGLSNLAVGNNQNFSERSDRSICPVPWFETEILTYQNTEINEDFSNTIPGKIRRMQLEVSQVLDRPTILTHKKQGSDEIIVHHEGYYSLSKVGSFLPRHMDERHEELKGAQGWLLPSRRSLSWLIYLSTPRDWDMERNGGALRTYPQRQQNIPSMTKSRIDKSTHDGNLQVGWVRLPTNDEREDEPVAVYMDSWYIPPPSLASATNVADIPLEPHCILYSVIEDIGDIAPSRTIVGNKTGRRYLTRPWLTESLQGMTVPDFLKACAEHDGIVGSAKKPSIEREERGKHHPQLLLFESRSIARRFSLLEDRSSWNDGNIPTGSVVEDIAPLRGSIVIFDSVQLPHEVLEMKSGIRRALAGWWHERTQQLPNVEEINNVGGEEL
jgi:hypothetical protein